MNEPMCTVCYRILPAGEPRCCPPQVAPNPEKHGAKCRRAGMELADATAFSLPETYGERFRAGWLAEDARIHNEKGKSNERRAT